MHSAFKDEFPVNLTLSPQKVELYHGRFVFTVGYRASTYPQNLLFSLHCDRKFGIDATLIIFYVTNHISS
jgi:hypothetical protein